MYRNISNLEFLNLAQKVDVIFEKHKGTVNAIQNILKNSNNKELKDTTNKILNEYVNYFYDAFTKKTTIQCLVPTTISKKLITKSNQITKQKNPNKEKIYNEQLRSL